MAKVGREHRQARVDVAAVPVCLEQGVDGKPVAVMWNST